MLCKRYTRLWRVGRLWIWWWAAARPGLVDGHGLKEEDPGWGGGVTGHGERGGEGSAAVRGEKLD